MHGWGHDCASVHELCQVGWIARGIWTVQRIGARLCLRLIRKFKAIGGRARRLGVAIAKYWVDS